MDDLTNPPAPMATEGVTRTQSDADLIEAALFGGDSGDATPAEQAQEQDAEANLPAEAAEGETPADNEDAPESETDAEPPADDDDLTLAGYLGLTDDQLTEGENGEILVKTKVNGQVETVTPEQLLRGYQSDKANTEKAQALAEERKQFEAQAQEAQQAYNNQLQQAQALAGMFQQELLKEYSGETMERLRISDPAEWAARQQEYGQKLQNLQAAQAQLNQAQQQQWQEAQAAQQQQREAYLAESMAKMIENNPTWADEEVRKAETTALRGFLTDTYGFNDQDFALVTDPRVVTVLQDAAKYRKMQSQGAPKAEKKVPKFQKAGGASRSKMSKAQATAKANRARLKQSGKVNDLAATLLDRM